MAKFDQLGNPVSYGRQEAIDALDQACDLLHAYQADPLAAVDRIIADDPVLQAGESCQPQVGEARGPTESGAGGVNGLPAASAGARGDVPVAAPRTLGAAQGAFSA